MRQSPSDRIGSNFTPTSKHLSIAGLREWRKRAAQERSRDRSHETLISAEKFSDKFLHLNFGKIFTHEFRKIFTLQFRKIFYTWISEKYLHLNFGQFFTLEFRTNFYPKTPVKCASDNFGLNYLI
jgi:hypothetical protein